MKRIKPIIFYLAFGIVINGLCTVLQSADFLNFLRKEILTILITLLAINTATISVVVAKLHDISVIKNKSFDATIREVKFSLLEQIVLIAVGALILILVNSPLIKARFIYHDSFFNTMLIAVFVYAIDILRDTGIAVFEIYNHAKK